MSAPQSEELARRLAELADSKKAEDIVVLDMRELVSYTDFLVICTARNERQARAIVDEVRLQVKHETGLLPGGVDGGGEAGWIVLDYLDCVLHVFTAGGPRALPARGALARGAAAGAGSRAPEAPSAASA